MEPSSRAPFYDLFKLIVAILLLVLFLFLLIWMRPAPAHRPESTLATLTSQPSLPTVVPASATSLPPTETPAPTVTSLATITPQLTPTSTVIPPPTESPVPEGLPTPIVEIPEEADVCEAVSRAHLQAGMHATIVRYLNFRSSPGILNNWIRTNPPGTQVEVIGGPACTRYENGGAYLWWQIRLPNGVIGWSAEASAFGRFYFMEPIK